MSANLRRLFLMVAFAAVFSLGLFFLLTNFEVLFMIGSDSQEGRADAGVLGLLLIAVGMLGLGWADRGR